MPRKKENTHQLKKLAILAKQNVNSRLHLQRTKSIKFKDKHYFALLLLISLFCAFAEGGGTVVNWFGDLPKGDSLLDQLEKFKEEDIKEQFRKLFEQQFKNIFRFRFVKPKVVLAIDVTDKPTYSKRKEYLFSIEIKHHVKRLDNAQIPKTLREEFKKKEYKLSQNAFVSVKKANKRWLINDNNHEYLIKNNRKKLNIFIRKKNDNIVGGKEKASTHHFFRFATIQIADKKNPLTLYVMHCNKKTTNEEIIEQLITQARKLVRIKCVLIDRGFYDTNVFNKLEQLGVKYLMPCKSDDKTNKMFKKHLNSNYEIEPYFCQNKKKEYADFKLIMVRLKSGKEIGYVTNMHFIKLHRAKYYINLYKRRWNIETGYRLQNMFLAKTCSLDPTVRLFYFCYAVSLHNLWVMIKSKVQNKNFNVPVLMFTFVLMMVVIAEFLDISKLIEIT